MVRAEAGPTGRPSTVGLAEGQVESRAGRTAPRSGPGASLSRIARYMIVYRHSDPRFPFLWENANQPPARWHGPGEGPVQYFADTPDGAWAEFLRHEGITDESDLANVRRALWAVEVPDHLTPEAPRVSQAALTGGLNTYEQCRKEARRMRNKGAAVLRAPSAALLPGAARG